MQCCIVVRARYIIFNFFLQVNFLLNRTTATLELKQKYFYENTIRTQTILTCRS